MPERELAYPRVVTPRGTTLRRIFSVALVLVGSVTALLGGMALMGVLLAIDPGDGPTWFEGALLLLGVAAVALGVRLAPHSRHRPPTGGW